MGRRKRCEVCGKKIKMMSQIGTKFCCRNCEKKGGK